jgi:hypothetical protein
MGSRIGKKDFTTKAQRTQRKHKEEVKRRMGENEIGGTQLVAFVS